MTSVAVRHRLPDDDARRLISRDGLARTLFVEAGAGSGKTTQLVERVVALVLDHGVELASIAAITFTEAAAAELRARVRAKLDGAASAAPTDARAQRARAALDELDGAAISTLHAFAARLLLEHPIEAGVPPRVGVLDDVSSQLAHEQRWLDFVDDLHRDPAEERTVLRAAALGIPLEPRYAGQATFRDVADVLTQNWDRIGDLADGPLPELGDIDLSEFDALAARLGALPDECRDRDDGFCRHLVENVLPDIERIRSQPDDVALLAALGIATWGPTSSGRSAAWDGAIKEHKATLRAAVDAAARVRSEATDAVLRRLLVLTAREVLAAARRRRAEGRLEYHDLLVLARELLRTSAPARRRLHERFAQLLLDEFQDTDPIQIELATLIAADPASPDDPSPPSWADLPVAEGRLFFVGDPKQSIYRFRRADIAVFDAARERFAGDGAVQLVTNFRTVGPILDAVNAVFAEVMPVEEPGVQPAHQPLQPHRTVSPDGDHRPVLLGGPHDDPKVKAPTLRELEASDVAATLVDIRDHPDRWPVFDRTLRTRDVEGAWRPALLSDVAVLVPTRTSLPYLRTALDAAGLPYRLATGTLVYDTQEVRDALAALRAVDDPTDELALLATLRSPLYACSDVDLTRYRAAGGRWDLRADPPPDLPTDDPVREALAHLRSLWTRRWWTSPADLLERLWRERHAALGAFGDTRPVEVWRRQRFLLDQARSFEEAGGGSLRAFLDWTALQGADGARVHEPLLDETDETALQILTVHGAKGLEFPITVLSGMTTRPAGPRHGVSVLWGDGPTPEVRMSASVATADHEPRADREQAMDRHEKRRLLYVATTRAKDHLVVSCHHCDADGDAAETHARTVWRALQDRPELWRRLPDDAPRQHDATPDEPASAADPAEVALEAAERDGWIAERAELARRWSRPPVIAATAVAKAATPTPVRTIAPDDLLGASRDGTAVGRAVHATLELVDLTDPDHGGAHGSLDDLVRGHCDAEGIADRVGDVSAMVRAALGSPSVQEAAAGTHHRETYVATTVGERVLEGFVDLLLDRPDGLVVVDYKSDALAGPDDADAAAERYRLQAAAYALALEAVTGRPVVECRFVLCGVTPALERSVRDLPGAIEEVRRLVTAH